MTSGYVYKPLRDIRDPESSVEMHNSDRYLDNNFDFDEYVRVGAAASNADAIEVSALSDLLRQYLLASVIKPKLKTMVSEDESAQASEDQSEELSTSGGDDRSTARKKSVEIKIRDPDLTLVNTALKNMIRVLIDDINNIIVNDVANKEAGQIIEELNLVYARLGSMAYAHHLITNDTALMPSDNTYTVDGLNVRVSRASKLFQYVYNELRLAVPIEQLLNFEIPRLDDTTNQSKEDYIKNYRLVVEVLEKLYGEIDERNKALTLTPALGVVTKTYRTKWEELGAWGKLSQWVTDKLLWLEDSEDSSGVRVKDETYATVVDLKDVAARVSQRDNVTKTFLESSGTSIKNQRDVLEKFNTDVIQLEPSEFYRRLLDGNYTLNALKTDSIRTRLTLNQRDERLQVRVADINVKLSEDVIVEARCVFVPVAEYLNQFVPSIMALSYPLYQTMTAPYSLKSTELVGGFNILDDDIENDELLSGFLDYLIALKTGPEPPEDAPEEEKRAYRAKFENETKLLTDERTAIYGDSDEAFKPRAGRVAHQWDSLYFHFIEKYGHGYIVDEKDTYDWLGFVVFKDRETMVNFTTRGANHRFYTIHDNSSVELPLTGKGRRERSQQRARNDNIRFNANILRERIIAEGAIHAFAQDTSSNKKKYKIWLSSIPDNTGIEFQQPQSTGPSDDSEATTELLSTIANFGISLGKKAFKYAFSSYYNATPADTPTLVASETKQIARQHRTHFAEKFAKVMPITDADTSLPLGSEERLRSKYHTEYVLFHNTGMTLKEVTEYATYLKAKPTTKRGGGKKAAKAPVQANEEESLLDADAAEMFDEDNKPAAARRSTKITVTSVPDESSDDADFED